MYFAVVSSTSMLQTGSFGIFTSLYLVFLAFNILTQRTYRSQAIVPLWSRPANRRAKKRRATTTITMPLALSPTIIGGCFALVIASPCSSLACWQRGLPPSNHQKICVTCRSRMTVINGLRMKERGKSDIKRGTLSEFEKW
jgi:hypothetical protein